MIDVEAAGALTLVQDLGRPGWQHLGVTPGGAMDRHAAVVANGLVGNAENAAVLEMTLLGGRFMFGDGRWIALTGAECDASLNGKSLPTWRPVWVPKGGRLEIGAARQGCRAYLAVGGGIDTPPVLGSLATDLRSKFGGVEGRPVQAGDRLRLKPEVLLPPDNPEAISLVTWRVAGYSPSAASEPTRLRLVVGADWRALSAPGRDQLMNGEFLVSGQSDRMGIRLTGPRLSLACTEERLSAGVAFGTVQLPPGGAPILLGVDRQTTGGYPVLGTVASVDHSRIAQLRPGEPVCFEPISVEEAQARYRAYRRGLLRFQQGLSCRWPLSARLQEHTKT